MFLPRRRITSLTLATFLVLIIYYLNLIPGFSPRSYENRPSSPYVKQKPVEDRLTPPEKGSTATSGGQDTPDRFREEDTDKTSSVVVAPSLAATAAAGSKDTSTEILTDHRPPPKNKSSKPKPVINPNVKTQTGQYVFGTRKFVEKNPVEKLRQFTKGDPKQLPPLQWAGQPETPENRKKRMERLDAVKQSFAHSWAGYKLHAWKKDEVKPVEGGSETSFGGWAASLVDTLDTLWIMGMKSEFKEAVDAAKTIDFTNTTEQTLNVFETTIRYLGGFLGAYDVSLDSDEDYSVLLQKAVEVGDLLYCAFDTPNRMPVTRWTWEQALDGEEQVADSGTLIAELGSLTLEFTRLSQLTGDVKYYDAVTRIMEELEKAQKETRLPGLWPTSVNARDLSFTGTGFTLGGMADSVYEYLPKQYMLIGGKEPMYEEMYKQVITASMNHIFYQPMLPDNADVLMPGSASVGATGDVKTKSDGQHLGCYAGGMVGIAAKLFEHQDQLATARKLVDGCIWSYEHMPTGIMPEYFRMLACQSNSDCTWDEKKYTEEVLRIHSFSAVSEMSESPTDDEKVKHIMKTNGLKPGFTDISDKRYILRPEAIESVFIHYRLTGDADLPDKAWRMFTAIENATRTDIANSAIHDVTVDKPEKADKMESFWMAETLKYFYLIFSEPGVISLDDYVFNTEAHPFRRPTAN